MGTGKRTRSQKRGDSGFSNSISSLITNCYSGKLPDNLLKINADLEQLRAGKDLPEYDGHFKNLIVGLGDVQFDRLKLIVPEDEIFAEFKQPDSDHWKSITNASAGQKTSSILSFVLSYGINPLLLDQPEDDLDNHLVYGLIVDRLRESKEKRQIIVITHNANIPVNGDAEYVFAMNSETSKISVLHEGTVENQEIKKEICTVMEGGEEAFRLRSKRYNLY